MRIEQLTEVWTPLSIAASILPGAVLGILIGRFASDPAYASGKASPLEYGVLIGGMVVLAGMIFYCFQIVTSYLGGDTNWTRVVSRFGLWVVYAAAIGIGTWIRVRRHIARKHTEAHDRAVAELGETKS